MPAVGTSVARKDGIGKANGTTKYADDLTFPGMLHGRTIRSTIPRGRITNIRLDFDTTGFTIVDYRDIPSGGRNIVALIEDDQPFLVETEVRHVAEPVVLLAHEDREKLLAAKVVIEYEAQEPEYDPERSTIILKALAIDKGNVEAGFAEADVIVEGTYRTGHQEHVYIEPNGVIAFPEKEGIAVFGSIQCPFYVVKALKSLLGKDAYVRVVQTETGGGFGGKEEYPSMIAGHATLLALKSGKPVKIIYDRTEDMIATTKRHPSIVRHRTGVKRDGTIVAMDVDIVLDGGAYITLSPVVISRGGIHA
ncbi:MAG: xanthine dehydrogenase family protein, partial [Gemmatimonadaceae bacterium]